ncbi:MAG: hypothetical protein C0401_01810 [Anaerolinea sp.]|nr:hypothetical protein [Anaerolinea sp.]
MKKLVVSLVIAGVFIAALGTAAVVNAQEPTPQPVYGQGGMGGHGMRGGMNGAEIENEAVHDLMMAAWADKLNLSVEELNTRTEAGEKLSQIALSTGMSFTDFWTLKTEIHSAVAEQALAEGLITQAEADLMQQSGTRQMNGGGMRGAGYGSGSNCSTTLPVAP